MRVHNWGSNLLKTAGVMLAVCTIAASAQMVNGQPQPLSPDQLQGVTGGGDCEKCETDEETCKSEDETTCLSYGSQGKYRKKVYTGQDEIHERTGKDSGVMDVEADTRLKCYESFTSCDIQGGNCVNCETTSTTGKVNTNCNAIDSDACPAS